MDSGSEIPEDLNEPLLHDIQSIKVYRVRWFILLIYCINIMNNGVMFMGLSAIPNVSAKFYEVNTVYIEWISNIFLLTYVFIALPGSFLNKRFGIRPILLVCSTLQLIGCALRLAGYQEEWFFLVVIGQVLGAISLGLILQVSSKLSFQWFPEYERATATTIGLLFNILGVALGFALPSSIVRETTDRKYLEEDLKLLFLVQFIMNLIAFLLTILFFREKPVTSPSPIIREESKESFTKILKLLISNKYFMVVANAYSLYYGLCCAVTVIVSSLVSINYGNGYSSLIGWMGCFYNIAACITSVFLAIWLDRYKKFQIGAILLTLGSVVMWTTFVIVLNYVHSFVAVFILFVLFGFVGVSYFATGVEQVAEMTYPVPEEISSGFLLTLANLYATIFIFTFAPVVQRGYPKTVEFVIAGIYLCSFVLSCLGKTELRRGNAESVAGSSSLAH